VANINTATKNDTTQEHTVQATCRLPESLWTAVRLHALRQKTSAQQIVRDALTDYMSDVEQTKAA
jgi:hypothetical protein